MEEQKKTTIDLANISRAHFVGVGGIGMSALARLFLHEKKAVSGSDRSPSEITRALQMEGATIYEGHAEANVPNDVDLVVYTEAITEKTEGYAELQEARARGITTLSYFDALGLIANQYYLIAVSGTHGKTTTTAMLIDVFELAGFDPTAVVGSLRAKTGSNFRAGKSKYFIVEACEYKRDFMSLEPDILVITNIEYEHVDYYKSLEDVQSAFRSLAEKVREGGAVITNLSDSYVQPVVKGLEASVIDYGKYFNPTLRLSVPGIHNQMNAAAARAVAEYCGIQRIDTDHALVNFPGTWRRFEYKGETKTGAKVYDDYAHHPTEIRATLQGARDLFKGKKITVVFQPHTYSRTYELFDDFIDELSKADRVILAPIYAAREMNESGVSSEQLAEKIPNALAKGTLEEITEEVKKSVSENDVVLVMGAGTIAQISPMLVG